MKKRHLFFAAVIFLMGSSSDASAPITEADREAGGRSTPIITYDFLKDNAALSQNFSLIDISGEKWHLHWHLEDFNIVKSFPEAQYDLVVHLNTGLREDPAGPFAGYSLNAISKETQEPHFINSPFYLSIPKTCRIGNCTGSSFKLPPNISLDHLIQPEFGFNQ